MKLVGPGHREKLQRAAATVRARARAARGAGPPADGSLQLRRRPAVSEMEPGALGVCSSRCGFCNAAVMPLSICGILVTSGAKLTWAL
jgi:hypothetical protein